MVNLKTAGTVNTWQSKLEREETKMFALVT